MSKPTARREPWASRGGATAVVVAVVTGLIGYEAAVHWAVVAGQGSAMGLAIALGPALGALLWVGLRLRRFGWLVLGFLVFLGAAVVVVQAGPRALTWLYPLPSVIIDLLLLWTFGRTLAPNRESLVTRLARYVHGTLPPEIEAYTRRVNWAWCLFFAAMAIASILLFAFTSLETWSLFANVLTLPLIALMFIVEYVYRISRYRNFAHASLFAAVKAFRDRSRAAASAERGG